MTQRNWMAMYLGRALQGRWRELGDSVHVLRRVDGFLGRHFSLDSEVRGHPFQRGEMDDCRRSEPMYVMCRSHWRGRSFCDLVDELAMPEHT